MKRTDPRPFALFIVVGLLLAGNALVYIDRTGVKTVQVLADNPAMLEGAAPAPTTTPPTTVAPPPSSVAVARLPRPRPPAPAGAYAAAPEAPVVQIGTIEIPKIGLVHPIFEGNTLREIDQGPSHWPGTAMPGEAGNAVFAGHRVTHTHPFLHIDELVPGDLVYFDIGGTRWTYQVTGHDVVTPRDTWIVNQTPTPTATLFACHPPHSATYRYVVHLALVG